MGIFRFLARYEIGRTAEEIDLQSIEVVLPKNLLDDGELDLVRAEPTSRLRLLGLFARLTRGKHLSARGVEHGRVSALRIEFDTPQPLVVDGETLTTSSLSIEVLSEALRVLAPR